ncbi:substrate-binding periplasmic protein [Roseateles oligotrophus]|uniref:Transporter substrate-binding domain-containing protein n=1 Tax=Roseateles oligotrophus TaxID=1769250 RepID=A0ABT2YLX8_9BURK|nr:transporter substrate-binding domain-containing protein [Roseateles oligotrophus]MCV2371070.1 transporter substrate-binding domain-containing protein [Roseateles oligotrophus]
MIKFRSARLARILVLGLGVCLASGASRALDLTGFSEDLPPFAYLDSDKHRGLANEVLDRISQRTGLGIKRVNMPWVRALREAQAEPNSLLYVTVRTPEREPQFLWVGPLDKCDIVLMKLRRRAELKFDPGQAAAPLQIGVGRGSPSAQLLRDAGVPETVIYQTPRSEIGVRMLFAERLDMLAGLLLPSLFQVQRHGFDPAELQAFHLLKPGYGCYFAFNPKVDAQLLTQFRKGFDELQSSGELQALREQYLRNPEQTR